jgi:hypothetical protein
MIARHLDGELAARRQQLQQAGEMIDVVLDPLVSGVAVEDARRHVRRELREVAFGEAHMLVDGLAARLGQHLVGGIDADDRRSGKALGEDARDVAGAAAEIVDRVARTCGVRRIEPPHQIERGPQAGIDEFQVEIGIPGRRLQVAHDHFSSNAASTGTR